MLSTGRQTTVGKQGLLEIVDECSLAGLYLGVKKLPCVITSPLRVDNHPSFSLYTRDGKTVYYRDFATGEKGSFLELLQKLWGLNYDKVIDRIYKNIDSSSSIKVNLLNHNKPILKSLDETTTILECKTREWRDYDIEYWKSYGITLEWLKYADVYPISHKIIIKDGKRMVFLADKYAYTYVEFKEGKTTHKFYQPLNKDGFKWQNNHDRSVVSLWTKVPKEGNIICICSSLKDSLCVWSNTGMPCINIQGEGYPLSQTAINELKRRFKKQIISLDGDKTGIEDAEKLSKLTGFPAYNTPIIGTSKDWSDIYHDYGKEFFIKTIKETFKNLIQWNAQ